MRRRLRAAADPLYKARYLAREARRDGRPIVVLSPGKAASTAVEATVAAHLPDRPAYKVHWLSDAALARSEAAYPVRHEHILASHHLRRHRPTPDAPWDVVVPVREPIARNVAAYFQVAERLGHPIDDPERAVAEMVARPEWQVPFTWFDTEVRDVLGIDVLAHPFDPAAGTLAVETPAVRLLVIRHEDLAAAPAALSAFLGVRIDELVRANVGAQKGYAAAYERFRAAAVIPEPVLDAAYATPIARHLWSAEEITRFRARWSGRP